MTIDRIENERAVRTHTTKQRDHFSAHSIEIRINRRKKESLKIYLRQKEDKKKDETEHIFVVALCKLINEIRDRCVSIICMALRFRFNCIRSMGLFLFCWIIYLCVNLCVYERVWVCACVLRRVSSSLFFYFYLSDAHSYPMRSSVFERSVMYAFYAIPFFYIPFFFFFFFLLLFVLDFGISFNSIKFLMPFLCNTN